MSAKASEERAADAMPAQAPAPKRTSGWVRFWRTYGLAILFVLMILVIWELWIRIFDVPKYLLASPTGIVTAMRKDWSRYLLPNLWPTLTEVLIGFGISVVAGVGLAIVLHLFAPLRRAVYPILIGSQTIPIVVLAPVLVILLGYGLLPKVVIVALICFFPIVVNTIDGLASVDPDLLKVMRTLDGNRWATLRRVEAPAALPSMFSGLRIAATYAPIGAVFGEYAGSQNGLGYVMIQAIPQLETDLVFAAIFILTFEAILLFIAVSVLERITCPWAREGKR